MTRRRKFASGFGVERGQRNIDACVLATLQTMHFRKSISRWSPSANSAVAAGNWLVAGPMKIKASSGLKFTRRCKIKSFRVTRRNRRVSETVCSVGNGKLLSMTGQFVSTLAIYSLFFNNSRMYIYLNCANESVFMKTWIEEFVISRNRRLLEFHRCELHKNWELYDTLS